MTQQATTTTVVKIQLSYCRTESYTTTSEHSTNTSTACDTPSIKVDVTDIRLSLCVNF